MPNSSGVKNGLYNHFQDGEDANARLYHKVAHKAMDIPDDDVNINVKKSGFSWKEMAVLGAVAIVGMLAWTFKPEGKPVSTPPPNVAPAETPAAEPAETQKYKVSFWKEDDTEIDVEIPK